MIDVVLFHSHGLGRFDFSAIRAEELTDIDRLAVHRHVYLCPTIYLRRSDVEAVEAMLRSFAERKADNQLPRILGFSIEGPVLGPRGGIPRGSMWTPDKRQWERVCSWFELGLNYIVMAPDVLALDERLDEQFSFSDLLDGVYARGGRIALGHFCRRSAHESARRTEEVLAYLESSYERSPYLVLTDHLFNDMPLNFRHAFRRSADQSSRHQLLQPLLDKEWLLSELPELLGPVPATLISMALEQRITPALNFDGGHVDLTICRRVVELLGEGRLIAMTDHTEILSLANESLTLDANTSLLYRDDAVLAASAVPHERHIDNMRSIGLIDPTIKRLFYDTPLEALEYVPREL